MISFELSDEQKEIRDWVHSFAEKEIRPVAHQYDESEEFPEASWDALTFWASDGTASYVGLMRVVGRIGERSGSFVLRGGGSYDGARARIDLTVVPGSGTGELAGIRGTATSLSTHQDYPFMPLALDYDVE